MTFRRVGFVLIGLLVATSPGPATGPGETADIGALLDRARTAAARNDHAGAIETLEQALDAVRVEAPLTLRAFTLVDRPAKVYGDYAPRRDAVLRRGEPLQFYLEPKNLIYERKSDGTYEVEFKADVRVLDKGGKLIFEQADFGSWQFVSRGRLQDLFMNVKLTLSGAPAGDYKIELVIRDGNSPKTATAAQPITLK
jgi:hypothetical protein